jgi:hypothetical protein
MVQYTAANMQNPSKRLQRKEKKKKKDPQPSSESLTPAHPHNSTAFFSQ